MWPTPQKQAVVAKQERVNALANEYLHKGLGDQNLWSWENGKRYEFDNCGDDFMVEMIKIGETFNWIRQKTNWSDWALQKCHDNWNMTSEIGSIGHESFWKSKIFKYDYQKHTKKRVKKFDFSKRWPQVNYNILGLCYNMKWCPSTGDHKESFLQSLEWKWTSPLWWEWPALTIHVVGLQTARSDHLRQPPASGGAGHIWEASTKSETNEIIWDVSTQEGCEKWDTSTKTVETIMR